MMILTTRTLHRRQEDGGDAEVVLTIFEPEQHEADDWRCVFDFDPPIKPRNVAGRGMDWIDAFVHSLAYARLYFESQWSKTGHWQGMSHLGLPETAETPRHDTPKPPPLEARGESFPVLTRRRLGIPSGDGSVREICLMLYSPFSTQPGLWKCAFSFDPMDGDSIRYGVGADFIESMLDALSGAKAVYDSMIPPGWTGPGDLLDCAYIPYKVGRAFYTDRVEYHNPDMPDFTPSWMRDGK